MIKAETTEGKTMGLTAQNWRHICKKKKITLNYVWGENIYNINNSKYLLS